MVQGLKLLFLNICSLRNKMENLYGILKNYGGFDIIIIAETHLKTDEISLFNIPGFTGIFNCRDIKKGGGTAIYLNEQLKHNLLENVEAFNKIAVEIRLEGKKIRLVTMYRPPERSNMVMFLDELEKTLDSPKLTILAGDLNIDLLKTDCVVTEKYMDLLSSYGYNIRNQICVQFATRTASCSIIDHIMTNLPNECFAKPVEIIDISFSDHDALSLSCKIQKEPKPSMTVKEFQITNSKRFTELVETYHNSIESPNMEDIIEILRTAKNQSTSIKKHRVSADSFKWMSLELIEMMKDRDMAYKIYKKHPNQPNKFHAYRNLETNVKLKIKEAKSSYFNRKITDSEGNNRKMWSVINEEILGKKSSSRVPIQELTEGDSTYENHVDIANILNSYFINYARTLRSPNRVNRTRHQINSHTIFMEPISENDIKDIIRNLKPKSSPGYDGITTPDLKLTVDILAPSLVSIFNSCLFNGEFPECLKETIIIPIHKDGDKKLCNNYRPISLLSILGKVFEKLINQRLLKFISSTTKIDKNQFGFQKNSGTDAALCQVTHKINQYVDIGEYVVVLFIDLRKAFDLVDHTTLIDVLEDLGIRGQTANLFKSYLSNRKVRTKVGDSYSKDLHLIDGVPQGSVLGPTLYLLYIDSLKCLGLRGEPTIYADDTCFLYHGQTKEQLEQQVKSDMGVYMTWLEGLNLVMNVNKTNFMLFRPKKKPDIQIQLETRSVEIEQCKTVKYLGVMLDDELSWRPHIKTISKKVLPVIGAIRRGARLSDSTCNVFYNAYVLSKIRPSILVWSQGCEENKRKVQVLMNRAMKALYRLDWYTSLSTLLEQFNIFSLEEIISMERCKFMYKVEKNLVKCNIKKKLLKGEDVYNYNLRNKKKIRTLTSKNNYMSKGIINNAINEFNKLDPNIKSSPSITMFNSKLKIRIRSIRNTI